jgi:hypothetical protein
LDQWEKALLSRSLVVKEISPIRVSFAEDRNSVDDVARIEPAVLQAVHPDGGEGQGKSGKSEI